MGCALFLLLLLLFIRQPIHPFFDPRLKVGSKIITMIIISCFDSPPPPSFVDARFAVIRGSRGLLDFDVV
jgi:hypothetical protein